MELANSTKLTIILFPIGAGGNFLINCLGLNNYSVFSRTDLINRQLAGKFTVEDKISFINENLDDSTDNWDDMGCGLGYMFEGYNGSDISQIGTIQLPALFPSTALMNIHKTGYHFCLGIHSEQQLNFMGKHTWNNAKIIIFKNCNYFMDWRKAESIPEDYWIQMRGTDWSIELPNSLKDLIHKIPLNEVTDTYSHIISSEFDSEIVEGGKIGRTYIDMQQCNNLIYSNASWIHPIVQVQQTSVFEWDNNYYFSEDATVNNIQKLYTLLDLPDYDAKTIRYYYRKWITKLNQLRYKKLNSIKNLNL